MDNNNSYSKALIDNNLTSGGLIDNSLASGGLIDNTLAFEELNMKQVYLIKENKKWLLNYRQILESGFITNILELDPSCNEIHLDNNICTLYSIEKVIQYLKNYKNPSKCKTLVNQIYQESILCDKLLQVIKTADYLHIQTLLDLCITKMSNLVNTVINNQDSQGFNNSPASGGLTTNLLHTIDKINKNNIS